MRPTQQLHEVGQSIWLDNITRALLTSGTLKRYIDELSVTGLTSNPTIFDNAIKNSQDYDAAIRQKLAEGKSGEDLFFDLALEDLTQAADLFRPINVATNGIDGWVSLEVSPKLAYDTASTLAAAKELHAAPGGRTSSSRSRGTPEGLPAIEEAIFAGRADERDAPLLAEQYLAAAEAYLRGLERRLDAGLNLAVCSVASLFISRWDKAVAKRADGDAQHPRHRGRQADLQGLPRPDQLAIATGGSPTPAPGRSGCSGPVRAPRIPTRRTCCTSRRSRRRSPSTRCPRRRCSTSPITASSASCCRPMAATRRRRSLASRGRRRRGRAGEPASEGRRRRLREVLERADGVHRREERPAGRRAERTRRRRR